MCAADSSLGDATTILDHGDEASIASYLSFDVKSLSYLGICSRKLSCQLLTDKAHLLIICSLAII